MLKNNFTVSQVSRLTLVCFALACLSIVLPSETLMAQGTGNASSTQAPDLVLGTGHSMKVNAVALSSDNRLLASASADNTIRLWDASSGRELRALVGHKGWVKCVAFSPDGRLIASGGNDKAIKVWDVATGSELHSLEGHSAPIEAIAFSADGRWLASGSADNSAKLWEVASAREINTLRGHSDWVTSVAFSFDGKWLATGSKDNTVRLWELGTGREARVLKGHTDRIKALAFSPNGEWLASGSADGMVKIWKTSNGKEARSLNSQAGSVIAVAFSGDGQQVLSASYNKVVKLWDVATGHAVRTAGDAGSLDFVESIAFASDGQSFASSADKSVELYQTANAKKILTFDSRAAGFYTIAFSANGRWFASGGKDKTVRVWDIATGRELPALVGHTGYVTSLAFSKDGNLIASASLDRTIRIWDVSTGRETRKLVGHADTINAVAFSPDDRWVASGSYDRTIRIWDARSGRETRQLSGHTAEVTTIAFSPNGKWLASGSVDRTVRIWDTTTWLETRQLKANSPLTSIAFSPDSQWLATAGTVTLQLFDATNWQEVRNVQTDSGQMRAVVFSPDSSLLAAACSDRAIRIWDVANLSAPRVLLGHSDSVNSIAFSADGKWIFSSSEDGSALLWDTTSGTKVATLMSLRESDDWLVVTPDGLFDGSPPAWSQILWRFAGNTFNHMPVEVFFNEFYYPGLLAEILSGKKPRAPLDISQKDRRQPQVNLSVAAAGNESDITTRTAAIKIDVTEARPNERQTAGSGVRDLRLFRNGLLVKVWHDELKLDHDGRSVLEAVVPILAGQNMFTAYAFNRDNIKSADAVLSLVGDDRLRRSGTAYILIAGVNQYANQAYNLRYAVSDAEDFGEQLRRAQARIGNFTDIQVIPLLDRDVTKANFMFALHRLADGDGAIAPPSSSELLQKLKKAQPEDEVVIYFAGHGAATQDGRFYLIPHDFGYNGPRTKLDGDSLRSILEHSISDRELEQALEGIDAGHLLLVIDACNSGQALEAEEKRRGPMNSKGLAQLAYEKGMYILTAAQSYQAALEQRRLGHGYLTYALVEEGLKTPAADVRPKDGEVELSEWLDYAVARVPLMQARTAADAQGRFLEQEDETDGKKKPRDIQRPRVFYRSGLEARQLVIAKP